MPVHSSISGRTKGGRKAAKTRTSGDPHILRVRASETLRLPFSNIPRTGGLLVVLNVPAGP
jgi:hypothetical protein